MEVSRFGTRGRIGKIVASDTFDGKITNWFHAACLLCHGRKQCNHVSSQQVLDNHKEETFGISKHAEIHG